jgi:hypothetical protein
MNSVPHGWFFDNKEWIVFIIATVLLWLLMMTGVHELDLRSAGWSLDQNQPRTGSALLACSFALMREGDTRDIARWEHRHGRACAKSVMAGLIPAIHVFPAREKEDVDARHKAGHDEWSVQPDVRPPDASHVSVAQPPANSC